MARCAQFNQLPTRGEQIVARQSTADTHTHIRTHIHLSAWTTCNFNQNTLLVCACVCVCEDTLWHEWDRLSEIGVMLTSWQPKSASARLLIFQLCPQKGQSSVDGKRHTRGVKARERYATRLLNDIAGFTCSLKRLKCSAHILSN